MSKLKKSLKIKHDISNYFGRPANSPIQLKDIIDKFSPEDYEKKILFKHKGCVWWVGNVIIDDSSITFVEFNERDQLITHDAFPDYPTPELLKDDN